MLKLYFMGLGSEKGYRPCLCRRSYWLLSYYSDFCCLCAAMISVAKHPVHFSLFDWYCTGARGFVHFEWLWCYRGIIIAIYISKYSKTQFKS